MRKLFIALLTAAMLAPSYSQAEIISFTDPVGDHTGLVDVIGMDLDIAASGDYSIDIFADAANPFVGDFRVNINLFNVSLDEYFQTAFNDFSLGTSQTSLTLTGNNANLTDWLGVHAIATSTLAGLGNPAGITLFRSSVSDLPFRPLCEAEDVIGIDGCNPDLSAIPIPAAFWLFGTALVGFVGYSRRRKIA